MTTKIKSICIFCGSNPGKSPIYTESIMSLVDIMSQKGMDIIYGGANVGSMAVLANYGLKKRCKVIGVIPQSLVDVEIAHPHLTQQYIVHSMAERKDKMQQLSDAFIMLPGGPGSLDEFFEMMTHAQLGYHHKPCGILNVAGYYDSLLQFLDHAVAEGFLRASHRDLVLVDDTAAGLIDKLSQYQPLKDPKWI